MSKQKENKTNEENIEEQVEETPATQGDEILDPVLVLEKEKEELTDQLFRAKAELDNFRKRSARDKEEAIKFAGGSVIQELLPVLDSFQMGLESARHEDSGSMIFKGMEMVSRQFQDFFDASGVKVSNPENEKFDPELHDAVSQEASGDVEEGHIIKVVRLGYTLRDRLLRPANVIVSSGPHEETQDDAKDAE